jgi:hypothetical protein
MAYNTNYSHFMNLFGIPVMQPPTHLPSAMPRQSPAPPLQQPMHPPTQPNQQYRRVNVNMEPDRYYPLLRSSAPSMRRTTFDEYYGSRPYEYYSGMPSYEYYFMHPMAVPHPTPEEYAHPTPAQASPAAQAAAQAAQAAAQAQAAQAAQAPAPPAPATQAAPAATAVPVAQQGGTTDIFRQLIAIFGGITENAQNGTVAAAGGGGMGDTHGSGNILTIEQLNRGTAVSTYRQATLAGMNEMEACAICQLDLVPNQIVRRINGCRHIFHQACIDTWFATHDICPNCRYNVATNPGANPTNGETTALPADDDDDDDNTGDNIIEADITTITGNNGEYTMNRRISRYNNFA